jgi:hypothetical protein
MSMFSVALLSMGCRVSALFLGKFGGKADERMFENWRLPWWRSVNEGGRECTKYPSAEVPLNTIRTAYTKEAFKSNYNPVRYAAISLQVHLEIQEMHLEGPGNTFRRA